MTAGGVFLIVAAVLLFAGSGFVFWITGSYAGMAIGVVGNIPFMRSVRRDSGH